MPRWGIHLAIGNKILEHKPNLDKNAFLFGNILPDLQDGYLIKDVSNITDHGKNHYDFFNGKPVYENFYNIYAHKLDNAMIYGYFTHLISDYCFNKKFEEKCLFNKQDNLIGYTNKDNKIIKKSKEECLKDKHLEFKIFESYIFRIYKINILYYDKSLLCQANEIDNINITIDDIKKAIYFIESCKESANLENNQCFIFENRELEDEILNVVKFSFELNKLSKQ